MFIYTRYLYTFNPTNRDSARYRNTENLRGSTAGVRGIKVHTNPAVVSGKKSDTTINQLTKIQETKLTKKEKRNYV